MRRRTSSGSFETVKGVYAMPAYYQAAPMTSIAPTYAAPI